MLIMLEITPCDKNIDKMPYNLALASFLFFKNKKPTLAPIFCCFLCLN